jgi:hypothetical protein
MAYLRTFKINDIYDSGEHTLNQKRKTIYNNTKSIITDFSASDNAYIVKFSKDKVVYSPAVNVDDVGCVVSANNYDLLLNVTKGKYLNYYSCLSDISYSLTGNINDSNLLIVDSSKIIQIYSTRDNSNSSNNNLIELSNQIMNNNIYSDPGVELVQDYSYNCDKFFFNMKTMQENIDNSLNNKSISYYDRLAKQDKLNRFDYPRRFKI